MVCASDARLMMTVACDARVGFPGNKGKGGRGGSGGWGGNGGSGGPGGMGGSGGPSYTYYSGSTCVLRLCAVPSIQ